MAYHWMHGDQALFWPNGSLATNYFRAFYETWYYPDGNIITYEAGYTGGRWFYPFQRLDGWYWPRDNIQQLGGRRRRFHLLKFHGQRKSIHSQRENSSKADIRRHRSIRCSRRALVNYAPVSGVGFSEAVRAGGCEYHWRAVLGASHYSRLNPE